MTEENNQIKNSIQYLSLNSLISDNHRDNDMAIFQNGKITLQIESTYDMPRKINEINKL